MVNKASHYSWKKALLIIFFTTLFPLALFFFFHACEDHSIEAIVQDSKNEPLTTACLAEIIGLSVDRPVSFKRFPLQEAKKRLLEMPQIMEVRLKKIRPNILYIQYALREPLAKIANHTNTYIDKEGCLFPQKPYYKARPLPLLYPAKGGHQVFLDLVQYEVKMIDLSSIDSPTYGERQIVVKMQNDALLRLSVRQYKDDLERYFLLEKEMDVSGKIIDLRIPNLAALSRA